jgi:hypothetical protein
MMDEGIMKLFDRTINKMERIGVAKSKEEIEKRQILELLNDTEKLNGTVSGMILKRFKHEMVLRKEKLAFALDKVYHLKHINPSIYYDLVEGTTLGKDSGLRNSLRPKTTKNAKGFNHVMGDLIISPVMPKEISTNGQFAL